MVKTLVRIIVVIRLEENKINSYIASSFILLYNSKDTRLKRLEMRK